MKVGMINEGVMMEKPIDYCPTCGRVKLEEVRDLCKRAFEAGFGAGMSELSGQYVVPWDMRDFQGWWERELREGQRRQKEGMRK